jgi:dihydrofolate synthase
LSDLFDGAKEAIDEAIELENGSLTHFEVVCYCKYAHLFSYED